MRKSQNKKAPTSGAFLILRNLRLTQQGQHGLRNLVGLSQYGRTSLLQDLRTGHVRHFSRVVRILNTAACGRQVVHGVVQVSDGGFETVLGRTQQASLSVNRFDCRIDICQRVTVGSAAAAYSTAPNVKAFSSGSTCSTVDGLAGSLGSCTGSVVQVKSWKKSG